jgi:hypothetical protein
MRRASAVASRGGSNRSARLFDEERLDFIEVGEEDVEMGVVGVTSFCNSDMGRWGWADEACLSFGCLMFLSRI